MFSGRSTFSREPNALARALAQKRERGAEIFDLTESNPTRAGISVAMELGAIPDYQPEPFGTSAARAVVGDAVGVPPERVVLTASTSEAYGFCFKLLCDPGDRVLVPQPSYPLLAHLAQLDAVELVPYRLAYDGAWYVDLDSVRRAVDARTRAIVTVNPNNPTGSYLKRTELEALQGLGLPIVSDEVFAAYPLELPRDAVTTVMSASGPLVIALGGLSKLCGLPQLKLAWALLGGPEPEVAEALARLELIADAYLSVSGPVQAALPRILERGAAAQRAIASRIDANRAFLVSALAGSPVTPLRLEGGWYAVLRLPAVRSEESWVVGLLTEASVLVQPGWFYDFAQEPFVIVSLLTPEQVFRAGSSLLAAYAAR